MRSSIRKNLRLTHSKVSPATWLTEFGKIAHHHSRPFHQFYDFFRLSHSSDSRMPSKWSCQCGNQVPLALSFCGHCGLRWDKTAKSATKPAAKPKQSGKERKDQAPAEPSDGSQFFVPSVGLSWQTDKNTLPLTGDAKMQAPKSLQTIIHQKANRAGKVTARIRKLEQALETVQKGWPSHVQHVQQQLQVKQAEVQRFQTDVNAELMQLRQELHHLSLLGQPAPPQTQPDLVTVQQVQNAMEVLNAAGLRFPSYAGTVDVSAHMEVEPQHFEAPQDFTLPNLQEPGFGVQSYVQTPVVSVDSVQQSRMSDPSHVPVTAAISQQVHAQVPQMPADSMHAHVRPTLVPGLEIPPGNWNPNIPQHFPNPLYKAPEAPILPVAEPTDVPTRWQYVPHPAPVNAEVAAYVEKAVQGLQDQHIQQQSPGGPTMPEQYQRQIDHSTAEPVSIANATVQTDDPPDSNQGITYECTKASITGTSATTTSSTGGCHLSCQHSREDPPANKIPRCVDSWSDDITSHNETAESRQSNPRCSSRATNHCWSRASDIRLAIAKPKEPDSCAHRSGRVRMVWPQPARPEPVEVGIANCREGVGPHFPKAGLHRTKNQRKVITLSELIPLSHQEQQLADTRELWDTLCQSWPAFSMFDGPLVFDCLPDLDPQYRTVLGSIPLWEGEAVRKVNIFVDGSIVIRIAMSHPMTPQHGHLL